MAAKCMLCFKKITIYYMDKLNLNFQGKEKHVLI